MIDPALSSVPTARLSPRQKECLRLIFERKTSKEISSMLGLSVGTVNTYITESIAALEARNRRHAAEILHASENQSAPEKVQLHFLGVGDQTPIPEAEASNDGAWRRSLPFRQSGASGNDLSIFLRLVWPLGLAILCAVAFGMLAIGVRTVSDIARALLR